MSENARQPSLCAFLPSTPWWDSPIVQQWIREGSVLPPIYLPKSEKDDD